MQTKDKVVISMRKQIINTKKTMQVCFIGAVCIFICTLIGFIMYLFNNTIFLYNILNIAVSLSVIYFVLGFFLYCILLIISNQYNTYILIYEKWKRKQ